MRTPENTIRFHQCGNMELVTGECVHAFPVHIHESLCIGRVTGGRAELMMNGRRSVLRAGDAYVIPPYTPHSLSSIGAEKFRYAVLCVKGVCPERTFSDSVLAAKRYIERAPAALRIDALAGAVHMSKYHLDRVFKAQIGITPYQFHIRGKIKKVRLGLQTHSPMPDLVFDLGFADQSHLCNTFKRHMGISPAQYVGSYWGDWCPGMAQF